MPGFDALYQQTITLFNRVQDWQGESVYWYPTIIEGVHLIIDKSDSWNAQGGQASDNAKLHIRYTVSGNDVLISCVGKNGQKESRRWYAPKAWRRLERPEEGLTFAHGNDEDFDFFVDGVFNEVEGPISDNLLGKNGFYNYVNAKYDNVFAITSVSKYNIIKHFEIMAR